MQVMNSLGYFYKGKYCLILMKVLLIRLMNNIEDGVYQIKNATQKKAIEFMD